MDVDDQGKVLCVCLKATVLNGVEMPAGQLVRVHALQLSGNSDIVAYDETKIKRIRTVEHDGLPVGCVARPAWDPWRMLD